MTVRKIRKNPSYTYDEGDGDESPPCPMCSGPLGVLGTLGNVTHYSCRNCGWQTDSREMERSEARAAMTTRKGRSTSASRTFNGVCGCTRPATKTVGGVGYCARCAPKKNPSKPSPLHSLTAVGVVLPAHTPITVIASRGGSRPAMGQTEDQFLASVRGEVGHTNVLGPVLFDGALKNMAFAASGGGRRIRTVMGFARDGHPAVGHFMATSHGDAIDQFKAAMKRQDFTGYTLAAVLLGAHWPVSPRSVYRVAHLVPKGY